MMIWSFLFVLIIAFLLCFYSLSILIKIAAKFSIYDQPNNIKKHKDTISYLGGIGIVFSFLIAIQLFKPDIIIHPFYSGSYFIILNIIFLYGLGDDIFNFKPNKKLIIQLLLSSLLIIKTGIHLPLEKISYLLGGNISILISIFILVGIVNAFNLIDGADGVAASLTLQSAIVFSIFFYIDNNMYFCLVSIALAGSIIAFLLYNFPSATIYMGDSGSLFIGLLLASFSLIYIDNGVTTTSIINFNTSQRIIIGLSSLSIPLLDMGRLIIYRIIKGKSPFRGDNNHIHHLLAKIGLNKKQVLLYIILAQMALTCVSLICFDKPLIIFIIINCIIYALIIQTAIQIGLKKR